MRPRARGTATWQDASSPRGELISSTGMPRNACFGVLEMPISPSRRAEVFASDARLRGEIARENASPAQTLNRKCVMSPSCITYCLPSARSLPASRMAFSLWNCSRSARVKISARMKPRSKSVWMTPAACGAVKPFWMG